MTFDTEVPGKKIPRRASIHQAVNTLMTTEAIEDIVTALRAMMKVPGGGARFTDESELAVYNPLLELYEVDPVKFREVILLVARKRSMSNMSYTETRPLFSGEAGEEKEARMKEFKQFAKDANARYITQIRAQMARVVKAENLMRPGSSQLIGNSRIEFQDRLWREWGQRRAAMLDAAAATKGSRLTHKEQSQLGDALRATIDREIEQLEEKVRQGMRK